MTRNVAYLLKGGLSAFVASAILVTSPFTPAGRLAAYGAEDMDALNMTALELQQTIEACQADYAAAREEVDAAAARIDETRARIEELEQQIPEQRERSAKAMREQYKFQQQSAGIVDFLLSSDSFYDFLSGVEYMERVSDANSSEIARLVQLKDEVVTEEERILETQREAEAKAEDARAAMEAAQEAQAEVQRRIEEEARLQAEIAAQAAKTAKQPRSNDSGAPAVGGEGAVDNPGKSEDANGASGTNGTREESTDKSPESGGETSEADGGTAEADAAEPVEAQPAEAEAVEPVEEAVAEEETADSGELSDEDAYIQEWTARIDAYLAGSPLAGQGETFARAAYTYGVDPRFSPAISFTESSKGLYCFKPHNAWGWGSSSWDNWEDAINAHVSGLASGYGGQLSKAAAKKYCPPNWQSWYDRTLAQMNMI